MGCKSSPPDMRGSSRLSGDAWVVSQVEVSSILVRGFGGGCTPRLVVDATWNVSTLIKRISVIRFKSSKALKGK